MIVAVGGHSRNVGKTSVAAGLIQAFRKYPWTAIKISSHRHANLSSLKKDDEENFCDIYEEFNREGSSDTARFLAAGASRSLWMRIKDDRSDTDAAIATDPAVLPVCVVRKQPGIAPDPSGFIYYGPQI